MVTWGDLGWWRWCGAVACVRMPAAMAPLALVLAGRDATGSFAFGGVLAAAHALAEAALAAPAGRLIDRSRSRAVVAGLLVVAAAAFGVLAIALEREWPPAALVVLAVAGSGAASGVPGALRADLAQLVPAERLQRALAIDAVLLEVVWVAAPVLAAGLAAAASPQLAVAAMGIAAAAAAVLASPGPGGPAAPVKRTGPILNRRAVAVLVTSAAMGYAEGSVGVALPPLLEQLGHEAELAGALLAVLSAASILGGLAYSRWHERWRLDAHRRADVLLILLAAGVLGLAQATTLAHLAGAVALIGLVVAPLNATRSYAMQADAPPGRQAEAFSVMYAAMGGGWGLSGLGLGVLLGSAGAGGALSFAGALAIVAAAGSLLLTRRPTA